MHSINRPLNYLAKIGLSIVLAAAAAPCLAAQWDDKAEKPACPDADQCEVGQILKQRLSPTMVAFRRGSQKNHALGQYEWQPTLEYLSGYENLNPAIQFEFAHDLHNYLKGRHLAWPAVQSKLNFDYLPYGQQMDFAKNWWDKHDPAFAKLGPIAQDKFCYEALVDATNIFGVYARAFWDSPKYQLFEAIAVTRLIEKK